MFEVLQALVPEGSTFLLWVVGALLSFGLLTMLGKALAAVLAPIPFVGPVLSFVVLTVAGQWQRYITEELPKMADAAVAATEAQAKGSLPSGELSEVDAVAKSQAKLRHADKVLKAQDPVAKSVPAPTRHAHIEAAVQRMKAGDGAGALASMLAEMKGAADAEIGQ